MTDAEVLAIVGEIRTLQATFTKARQDYRVAAAAVNEAQRHLSEAGDDLRAAQKRLVVAASGSELMEAV